MYLWRSLSRSRAWRMLRGLCALSILLGSSATLAQTVLLLPAGVAYDASGNLFVADTRKNQIFEVTLSGMTTVVAGTGEQGFSGDGGVATNALLNGPTSVAVGTDGTIYIADTGNQRIRVVAGGQIQTAAGSGAKGFSGDGGDAHLATLNGPLALALAGDGSVLIADSGNHRLRRLSGGALTTVAGTGVQGFAGDRLQAALAQMDTPAGVAVASDGRIFVADSHNHRIRVIATDGTMTTFAGNGIRGFSGDGGKATSASLFLPRGVAITPAGDVIFADSDNQRLRSINAQGVITTIAGSGVQGTSPDGTVASSALLDSPRAVAVSSFAAPVFADAHNHLVQEVAADANLYALPGGTSRAATVTLLPLAGLTYGQGTIAATVNAVPASQGNVALFDGSISIGTATLLNSVVTFPADTLAAGMHTLTARFAGDGLHSAAASPAVAVSVLPAPAAATAQATTIAYGTTTPPLLGTVAGILPRDAATVVTSFTTSAPDLSPVGTYSITASLSGLSSSNYVVTLAPSSGSLQIVPAAVMVAVTAPQISYTGLPVTMTASVGATTRGSPTGTVNFSDSGANVATGNIAGGIATAIYLSPGSGSHSISASYNGDHNFLAAVSVPTPVIVSAMPDFTLAVSGSATQTVPGGGTASYQLQVLSQPAPFSGAVNLSTRGLPPGAIASFSPVVVIPGNGSVTVNLSIQTTALAMSSVKPDLTFGALLMAGIVCSHRRRKRRKFVSLLLLVSAMFGLSFSVGCGDRSFTSAPVAAQSFPITVTATSTNLAGAIVTHTTSVALVIQ